MITLVADEHLAVLIRRAAAREQELAGAGALGPEGLEQLRPRAFEDLDPVVEHIGHDLCLF